MFVRRGVDDYLRTIRIEDRAHPRLIADVSDQGHNRLRWISPSQFMVDIKECKFCALDQQQIGRGKSLHLSRQLRSDRTTSSGHHNCLAGQFFIKRLNIQFHWIATQKVFDLDVANAANLYTAFNNFVKLGDDSDFDWNFFAYPDDAANLISRRVRDCDDDMIDFERADELRQLLCGSQNLVTLNNCLPSFCSIVIDKSFDFQIEIATRLNLFRRQQSRAARAD